MFSPFTDFKSDLNPSGSNNRVLMLLLSATCQISVDTNSTSSLTVNVTPSN